ncbi:beta-galactosidase [Rhizocola hellebori]|uniref:Beta-galactosidase n=1 Tax=Rhizocola hellebori TaxID=1392758 RepID=A0A8J3VGT9_9ACTN|nr:beta-galactosidase [Rhizocola hellebori]GIH05517.1 beta-galactosidase [Rhizocola hellebori]
MTGPRWLRWPAALQEAGLAFGADYNPEQWPRETWPEDVRAMREAGVNIVTLGVFSWAQLQPTAGTWSFGWLDEVMDLLHDNGIAVDLATATASPPPWLSRLHPEILPVTARGETLWHGGRQHWRPTSPVFRGYALRLVEAMATRYGGHPALAAWHVSNELGCHNVYDYSDDAAAAFRTWLRARYGTVEQLNEAWGTAFWSQRYSDWEEIIPPRLAASFPNPTQQLDFKRFSSDALKDYFRAEREVLRAITPDIPVTTNFMVTGDINGMDYADWAGEVDFLANDHYVTQGFPELLFCANLTGNLAQGRPWFLMEHSTSAVNWQPINVSKRDGELARDSLSHVAHGADAVCFFQWRAARAGAEKYHSAMVPHAGTDSALFRSVADLGRALRALAPVASTRRKPASVAILVDWPSWWACEQDSHPTERLRYKQEALDWYIALQQLGVRADVVPSSAALDGYAVVVAPILHVVPPALATRLTDYVTAGGHLVTTYFSGIVDESDHIILGGYPGALRDLLGIRIEEFSPLRDGESADLDNGCTATLWTDRIDLTDPGVEVFARYTSGEHSGRPAITHRPVAGGSASYVSARLGPHGLSLFLQRFLAVADVHSELPASARGRVELAIREGDQGEFWFLINLTDDPAGVEGIEGTVLYPLSGTEPGVLAPRGVAVVRRG